MLRIHELIDQRTRIEIFDARMIKLFAMTDWPRRRCDCEGHVYIIEAPHTEVWAWVQEELEALTDWLGAEAIRVRHQRQR